MIPEDLTHLDKLILDNRSFAIYRIPGETACHFVMQKSGDVRLLHDTEELNNEQGFVIAPFHITENCPIALIRKDISKTFTVPTLEELTTVSKNFKSEATQKEDAKILYNKVFSIFSAPLKNRQFDKLILSRNIVLDREESFSPAKAFIAACRKYIRSYVYLCHTPETGTWLGSTPEILLSGENNQWHTVALAGTQPLQSEELPQSWDDKNKEEQQLVVNYIKKQLSSLDIQPAEEGPYTVRAGELAHIKSDFRFSLNDHTRLGSLLKLLHPTPAICGLPKEEAYSFILKNEEHNRKYYSGFIGWLNPTGKSDLYVNLRCMQIEEKSLTLYAGSGLLASSTLNEEWQETEDKLQTMLYLTKSE